MSHGSNTSKGVAILLGSKLDYELLNTVVDSKGRYIVLLIRIQGSSFLLINSYQPNDEKNQVEVLKELIATVGTLDIPVHTPIIWGGDFNIIFDLHLDSFGGNPTLKIKTIETLRTFFDELDLCDIWRVRNPSVKHYTWSGIAQGKSTDKDERIRRRLDYFFISDCLQSSVDKLEIIPAPSTDHSALLLKLSSVEEEKRGPSFWKFNNSLLNDENYVKDINYLIGEIKENWQKDEAQGAHSRS